MSQTVKSFLLVLIGFLLGYLSSSFVSTEKELVNLSSESQESSQDVLDLKKEMPVNPKLVDTASNKALPTVLMEKLVALEAENKELKAQLNKLPGSDEPAFGFEDIEISQGDLDLARSNIEAALLDGPEEYRSFMQGKLDEHLSKLDSVGLVDKSTVDFYNQDIDYDWANQAEAFIQSYFASLTDARYKLIQVKCRTSSCELFIHLLMEEEINRETDTPLLSIQAFKLIQEMSEAPNYATYFSTPGTMSSEPLDDNRTVLVYSFLKRAK